MSFHPSNPHQFFEDMGPARVAEAITNDEFHEPLLSKAEGWLANRTSIKTAITGTRTLWLRVIGACLTIAGIVVPILLHKP